MGNAEYELAILVKSLLPPNYCLKCSKCCKTYFPDKGPEIFYNEDRGEVVRGIKKNRDKLILDGKDPFKLAEFVKQKNCLPLDTCYDCACVLYSHSDGKCTIYENRPVTCREYPAFLCSEEETKELGNLFGLHTNSEMLIIVDKRCDQWKIVNNSLRRRGFKTFPISFSDLLDRLESV
jgi:Fe-S-cluster containining protein